MSKKEWKFKFIAVEELELATALVSRGYKLEICLHSPKHRKHKYLFYATDEVKQEIESLRNLEGTVDIVSYLKSAEKIHDEFHGVCNDH
jgi:hypothetical protein